MIVNTRSCYSLAVILSTILMLLAAPPARSQMETTPGCPTTAVDRDGDGFGWWRYQTCVVDEFTVAKPELVNPVTGELIELVRPYWHGNRDIAEREIECRWFQLNSESLRYVESAHPIDVVVHAQLPNQWPYVGRIESGVSINVLRQHPGWTISDGIYHGPMPLAAAGWVEQVGEPGSAGSFVRYWDRQLEATGRLDSYFSCRDLSGAGFGPTGYPDEPVPEDNTLPQPELLLMGSVFEERTDPVINLETGERVILQTRVWDVGREIIGQSWFCQAYFWIEQDSSYGTWVRDYDFRSIYFPPYDKTSEEKGSILSFFDHDRIPTTGEWQRDGSTFATNLHGMPGGIAFHQQIEIIDPQIVNQQNSFIKTDSAFRAWVSSEEYRQCYHVGTIVGMSGHEFVVQLLEAAQPQPEPDSPDDNETSDEESVLGSDTDTDSGSGSQSLTGAGTSGGGGGALGSYFSILLVFCLLVVGRARGQISCCVNPKVALSMRQLYFRLRMWCMR